MNAEAQEAVLSVLRDLRAGQHRIDERLARLEDRVGAVERKSDSLAAFVRSRMIAGA